MMHEKIDLVSQPKKSFWKLSIPIIAFCIFDSIYGIVDMAWITQINIHASFAVGISIPFVSLVLPFPISCHIYHQIYYILYTLKYQAKGFKLSNKF